MFGQDFFPTEVEKNLIEHFDLFLRIVVDRLCFLNHIYKLTLVFISSLLLCVCGDVNKNFVLTEACFRFYNRLSGLPGKCS